MPNVRALAAACHAADGVHPFSDQALVEFDRGERRAVGDRDAVAVVSDALDEAEFAVHPDARRRGLGLALARRLVAEHAGGRLDFWAHGDLPGATAIAEHLGLTRVRTLLQLRAPVPEAAPEEAQSREIRAFREADTDALLALNAAAFADHPEQGRMTAEDFAARRSEQWHDDANLLVAPGERGLDAFAWIKPDADVAELYVLGVRPGLQGAGLGKRMLQATFARMRALGYDVAHLYVEGDNAPALALYRRAGFTDWMRDTRWRYTSA